MRIIIKSSPYILTPMLLAGDIGGTKTLLGLYSVDTRTPCASEIRQFSTLDFNSLVDVVAEFLHASHSAERIAAACFGVAGPVKGHTAQLTNVPWLVDATHVARRFSITRVRLVNDLAAMARAVSVLTSNQLAVIRRGKPDPTGNAALIAPGTGLGQVLLLNVKGKFIPVSSEGGHADFAARTEREMGLVREMTARFGRISYEQVISGPGLVRLHRFVHKARVCPIVPSNTSGVDLPALISQSGLERSCPACVETLDLFVSALGAEAGNLGLRSVATAGVYLGGGIPAKILTALKTPTFFDAFRSKFPMHRLIDALPITVIIEPQSALIGAAIAARELSEEIQ